MDRLRVRVPAILLAVSMLLTGCATSPFVELDAGVDPIGPADALSNPAQAGRQVIWGGEIVAVYNLEGFTELEIVARPLDGADRPKRQAEGGVRFIIRQAGFLEPLTYAPGRFVTALGTFDGVEMRDVGQFTTDQPVLNSRQIELWPVVEQSPFDNISVGVGVQL
ncbi:MAG: Slp family lipoprotein [Pseudomonadota bacterium]